MYIFSTLLLLERPAGYFDFVDVFELLPFERVG